jgi:hypothetical protein
MKPLTNTQLNRVKIKDLMVKIKEEINPEKGMGLYRIELLDKIGKDALAKATDHDLERIEKLFIKTKLGIEYFPSQRKKEITINGSPKIVSIDYQYGSENI